MIPIVLKNNKQIKDYTWSNNEFNCTLNGIYVNLGNTSNVSINVQSGCRIITGNDCKITAGTDCHFTTGENCQISHKGNCSFKLKKSVVKHDSIVSHKLRLFKIDSICFMSVNGIEYPISEEVFTNIKNIYLTFETG